jgi:hypothetical protein
MRKTLLFWALICVASFPVIAAAAGNFVPLAPIPGLTEGAIADTAGLATFFNNLYKYLIGLSAAIAVVMIIWGGLEYSTQDSISKKSNGKQRIYQAILGLVLVLAPVLVFSVINPSILNLSINLEPLKTATGTTTPVGGGGPSSGPGIPLSGGRSATRISGWWCYELQAGGYWCAATEDACGNHLVGGAVQSGGNPDPEAQEGTSCTKSTGAIATSCNVTGAAGVLQVATCASLQEAKTWGSDCTSGALSVSETENRSNGVITYTATCSEQRNYVFIYTKPLISLTVNAVQPLSSTPTNPNNGSQVMQFADICRSANLQTCISDSPNISLSVPCNLTGANAATSWKCYNEKLICKDASFVNTYCASSPSWAPFQ